MFKDLISRLDRHLNKYRFYETLKHTKNYFGSFLLVNALGIIALPVFTKLLSPAEYGIVEVFNSLVKALVVVTVLNTHGAIGRYYYQGKEDFKEFMGTAMMTIFGLIIISFSFLWASQDYFFAWLNLPLNISGFIYPAVLASVLFSVFNQLYIPRKKSLLIAKATTVWSYGSFLFALLFIWLLEKNYVGKVAGTTVFFSLMAVYFIYKIAPELRLKFSKAHFRYIFWIAIPLLPTAMGGFILNYLDQFFIISTESQTDAGLYSFAYKIGMLLFGFNTAIYNAAVPDFFKWKNEDETAKIRDQEKSMMRFMVLAAGFLVLFASDLGHLLSSRDAFNVALPLIPIIVAGYLFLGFFSFYSRVIFHSNKNIFISLATIIAGVANIILNFIYIPVYGYEAAAYTTLASYFIMFLLGWIITHFAIEGEKPSIISISGFIAVFGIIYALTSVVNRLLLAPFPDFLLNCLIFIGLGSFLFRNKIRPLIMNFFEKKS